MRKIRVEVRSVTNAFKELRAEVQRFRSPELPNPHWCLAKNPALFLSFPRVVAARGIPEQFKRLHEV